MLGYASCGARGSPTRHGAPEISGSSGAGGPREHHERLACATEAGGGGGQQAASPRCRIAASCRLAVRLARRAGRRVQQVVQQVERRHAHETADREERLVVERVRGHLGTAPHTAAPVALPGVGVVAWVGGRGEVGGSTL